jgi:hypothetical protein
VSLRAPRPKPSKTDRFAHLTKEELAALKELAQVEQALAALEGRKVASPEDIAMARRDAERMRRDLATVLEKRGDHTRARRRAWRIGLLVGAVVLGAAAAGAVIATPFVRTALAERAKASEEAARAAEPFERAGFVPLQTSTGSETTEISAARGNCYIAVAGSAKGPARVRIDRGVVSAEGNLSAGWCSCGSESIRIKATGPEPIEVRVLSAAAGHVGGADLLGILPVPPAARIAETVDRVCAEGAIDGWIGAHSAGATPAELPPVDDQGMAVLQFTRVGFAPARMPLLVVPEAKDSCWIGVSSDQNDSLSLRSPGGERPLPMKRWAIGFCGKALSGMSVWREGRGDISLFAVGAERVGGLLGMREAAERLGLPIALWAPSSDLAFDARAALTASGILPTDPSAATHLAGEGSLIALSTDERSGLAVDDSALDVVCRPRVKVGVNQSMCLETRTHALAPAESLPPGAVYGRRPLWLPIVKGNRQQNERALDMLAFARRMAVSGFELTTLTSVVHNAAGAAVTGRSDEKEIVAISVSTTAPFVHTLSDGAEWKLGENPRVVPLPAGKTVMLRAFPPYASGSHEPLVWRR